MRGRPGAGVAQVSRGLSLRLGIRQTAAHRGEVLGEEGDRRLDLRPRGLTDLATDFAESAAGADVDEGDRHLQLLSRRRGGRGRRLRRRPRPPTSPRGQAAFEQPPRIGPFGHAVVVAL